jgi:light-regulated signal transduction histidine kinase (bacteriophytochrome)
MMAYAASHDLQEPLRTILNWGGFLGEEHGHLLPPEGKEMLGYIMESAARGRALVIDLLQLSRVGRELHFGAVQMNDVVDKAVIDMELAVRETAATVTRDDLPEVWGDASMLRLLVKNLISNAIKFTKKGVTPRISVSAKVTDTGWEFGVQDEGIGLDPSYAEKVFGVFARIGVGPGTGIGLAICQKIAKLHEGSIWIESAPECGATVRFTLSSKPTNDPETQTNPSGGGSPPGRKDARASVVGDENSTRASYGPGRRPSLAVLAEGGGVLGRTTPRFGIARFKSTEGDGL